MKTPRPEAGDAIDVALEWIERLRDGEAHHEAFFDWLTESPRHVEVFMRAMILERRVAGIAPEDWQALGRAAFGAPDTAEPSNVIRLPRESAHEHEHSHHGAERLAVASVTTRKPRRSGWIGAIALGVALAATLAWFMLSPLLLGWETFTTTVGEQRTIQLKDGSLVNLNTDSHLQVRLSASSRELRLIEGEALFKVQHDSARPFRVHTADTMIEAVGTQFNVYRRVDGTRVSVLEGRVHVASEATGSNDRAQPGDSASRGGFAALSAGEQADVTRGGKLEHRSKLNPARAMAWQERRLIFDEETLANIVLEFNRYNHRTFAIADPAAGERRFSGIFDADDPESLADLLGHESTLSVERHPGEIVIRGR